MHCILYHVCRTSDSYTPYTNPGTVRYLDTEYCKYTHVILGQLWETSQGVCDRAQTLLLLFYFSYVIFEKQLSLNVELLPCTKQIITTYHLQLATNELLKALPEKHIAVKFLIGASDTKSHLILY